VAQGTGKRFNVGNGYWLIAPDDSTPGVVVHRSAIEADGYRNLQDSQRVKYTVTVGSKGPQADHG
jgi:CspA family cold shock protein